MVRSGDGGHDVNVHRPSPRLHPPVVEAMTYVGAEGDELPLLVTRPEPGGRPPIVLDLHGGAWTWFSPGVDVVWCRALAERGYVVVAAGFRSAIEAPWPGPFADQQAALAWVRKHADDLGGDPDRIVVIGGSTGGHAALLTGIHGDIDGERPAAVVALWPVADVPGRYQLVVDARFDPVTRRLAARVARRVRHGDSSGSLQTDHRGLAAAPAADPVADRMRRLDDASRTHPRRAAVVARLLQRANAVQGRVPLARALLYERLRFAHDRTFPGGVGEMAAASPVHLLRDRQGERRAASGPALPPALVVHADRDVNTTEAMSRDVVVAWRAAGGPARFELERGVGHSYGNIAGPRADELVDRILGFLRSEGLGA